MQVSRINSSSFSSSSSSVRPQNLQSVFAGSVRKTWSRTIRYG